MIDVEYETSASDYVVDMALTELPPFPIGMTYAVELEYRFVSLLVVGPLLALMTYEVLANGARSRFTEIVVPDPPPGGSGESLAGNDNELLAAKAA